MALRQEAKSAVRKVQGVLAKLPPPGDDRSEWDSELLPHMDGFVSALRDDVGETYF
jgi:hypothetical protein